MESIVLDRSEFVALAALMRAGDIIGVDAAQLLPATPLERQSLYLEGERRLVRRGLARLGAAAHRVQLDADLLRFARAITEPENAVVAIRHIPGRGQFLFVYYQREGVWVEQSFPDPGSHHLASVGDSAALLARLLALFDFPPPGSGGADVGVDMAGFVNMVRAAREGVTADAEAAGASDLAAFNALNAAYVSGPANGTIAFIPIREGRQCEPLEIALARGRDAAWVIVADREDAGRVRAFCNDRDALAAALRALIGAMEETPDDRA